SNRHGEPDQACFGRSVIGLYSLSHVPENAGDVDDSPPTLLQDRTNCRLNAQVRTSKIRVQNGVPVGSLHPHHELIARNSGIVDKNVNLPKTVSSRLECRLDLFLLCNVHSEAGSLSTGRSNLGFDLLKLFEIAGG